MRDAKLFASGQEWIGGGIGSIETGLRDLLAGADREVLLITYSITSGSNRLIGWMQDALNRGVMVKMVVNHPANQPPATMNRLQNLAGEYPHFQLYSFKSNGGADLHAKAVIADQTSALVGSYNLSKRGLLHNHELAILFEGPVVEDLVRLFTALITSKLVTGPV